MRLPASRILIFIILSEYLIGWLCPVHIDVYWTYRKLNNIPFSCLSPAPPLSIFVPFQINVVNIENIPAGESIKNLSASVETVQIEAVDQLN